MINGRSLYNFSLGRRTGDSQEKFGVGSLLAFCSAKVLRGGPRTLVQLTTCVVALVLVLKLWHHGVTDYDYNGWSWTNPWDGDEVQTPVEEDDGSVPGGLRIVVFGENDIATPPRGVQDPNNRSWTEVLCEELNCSSYLSLIPPTDNPSHVMASTRLYAGSVERALNLTFEDPGPGYDYEFMLEKFPIEWSVNDFSKQVDQFLSMKKPRHSPAETLWVLSFGMWDIWSLASEPLSVSKTVVESAVELVFQEVERLYASAMDETSIAWSNPPAQTNGTKSSDGQTTPTSGPETVDPWKETPAEGSAEKAGTETKTARKQFRIIVPKVFDPSLTPGWASNRPDTPVVHSKAEQMRNAAALTKTWNDKVAREMKEWLKTEERREAAAKIEPLHPKDPAPATENGKTAVEIVNEKMSASHTSMEQRQQAKAAVPAGGQNHVAPPAPTSSNNAEAPANDTGMAIPAPPQRQGVLYDMAQYLEEAIVQRQLINYGLRDARQAGKLTEEGFLEVWEPCVAGQLEASSPAEASTNTTEPLGQTDGAVEEGDAPYQRKRSAVPAIRGRTLTPVEGASSEEGAPPAEGASPDSAVPAEGASSVEGTAEERTAGAKVCKDPNEHLFYTPFSVSPRAVAVIARQAADILKKEGMAQFGWVSTTS